jgi:hypothetical protein
VLVTSLAHHRAACTAVDFRASELHDNEPFHSSNH